MGRVDRDLQEVLDAQVYIMEELMEPGAEGLEALMRDFNFVLDKVVKTIFVSSDSSAVTTTLTPKTVSLPTVSAMETKRRDKLKTLWSRLLGTVAFS